MRNPHGEGGAEWKGDWSDNSSRWTKRFKDKLGYSSKDMQDDGIFWIELDDFIEQFDNLYICYTLSTADGWKKFAIDGEWKGSSSQGIPTSQNKGAKIDLLPQYNICIQKPCQGYISLR